MISKEILNIDWLNATSEKLNRADKILLEKVCRAVLLLEGLVESRLDFIFKGGTAAMLLLDQPRRFSIDIDIIVDRSDNLEEAFQSFTIEKSFLRFELQARKQNSEIEKHHYKFYYNPIYRTSQSEDAVLLDILVEKNQYKEIKSAPIHLPFLTQKGDPLSVRIPSVNDLIADKLTAFAPNTTGIPYEKSGQSMSLEIIKQLYDIGTLFEKADNPKTISQVFQAIAKTELHYRKLDQHYNEVVEDILSTSLCISSRGKLGDGEFPALQTGIRRISSYIFSERYSIEKAILHASHTAYLAHLIQQKGSGITFYDGPEKIGDLLINNTALNRLNRLKKSNPEAFYYWYLVSQFEAEQE